MAGYNLQWAVAIRLQSANQHALPYINTFLPLYIFFKIFQKLRNISLAPFSPAQPSRISCNIRYLPLSLVLCNAHSPHSSLFIGVGVIHNLPSYDRVSERVYMINYQLISIPQLNFRQVEWLDELALEESWKSLPQPILSSMLICSRHFEDRFQIRSEGEAAEYVLTSDALPKSTDS